MQQIFYPVLSSRTTITQNTAFNIDGKKCYIECQGLPLFDDNGTLIGVMNVSYDKTEQEQRQIYQEIEQHINFLNALPGRMDEILKEFFIRVCRLDHVNFGGVYILNENTQCLELIFHYNLPDHFVKKVESYGRDTNQFKTVAAGFPVYDLIDRQPPDAQTIFADMGIKAIAVIPLTQGETILGCLNLASSVANPFTESRKIFIEGAAWRISSIIGLNLAHEKQVKTVEILNETISDLRVKQQLLIQKSKMESLGELSAGMAHEINQPLVIISLSIENILQKINAQQKDISLTYLRKKFDSMQLNVIRIQHIIDNLRIFARDQSGILFEKVNIGTVITSTLEMIGPQLKKDEIYFLRDNADENLFVLGNIFKLEQVLLNIFSNSIYAVNQKMAGDATGEYKKRIGINISASNDQIIINLYDNGVGIQADHLEKLFTPFFTTKREGQGTGLGLPIVYGIIKEMNGEIKVTSKPDEFTNVQLIFPAV
jgi:C4-dicarboxylate-specific signal transduction histidine kinase